MKKNANVHPPNVEDNSVFNPSLLHNARYTAIVLAVHDLDEKDLYAILASTTKKGRLQKEWKVAATRFGPRLTHDQKIYFCVPLKNREGKFDDHLRLSANVLWLAFYHLPIDLTRGFKQLSRNASYCVQY